MDPANYGAEKLKGESRNDLSASRRENEEKLVTLDVSKLDALTLLRDHREIKLATKVSAAHRSDLLSVSSPYLRRKELSCLPGPR